MGFGDGGGWTNVWRTLGGESIFFNGRDKVFTRLSARVGHAEDWRHELVNFCEMIRHIGWYLMRCN